MDMKIEGLDALIAKLDSLGGNVDKVCRKAMVISTQKVLATATESCPKKLGQLRASLCLMVNPEDGEIKGMVGTNLEYAPYVEFGTGYVGDEHPHPQDAELGITRSHPVREYKDKNGNVRQVKGWVYKDKIKGKFYFTRGQPARPFLYPALQKNRENITEIFQNALHEEIKKK